LKTATYCCKAERQIQLDAWDLRTLHASVNRENCSQMAEKEQWSPGSLQI